MQTCSRLSTLARKHPSNLWIIIFAVAIGIRLLNIAILPTSTENLLKEDASLYWSGAMVLLEHGSFSISLGDDVVPQTERVPGYFLLLATVQALFDDSLVAALVVQSLLDTITCLLIAGLAATYCKRLALPAGLLAALWPNLIVHSAMILSDSLFLMLFSAMLLACSRFLKSGEARWAAAAGLALGLAIMTRPVAQLLPFLMLPAAFAVPIRHRRGAGTAALITLLFFAGSILTSVPLLHGDFEQFGTVVLTSQTGVF